MLGGVFATNLAGRPRRNQIEKIGKIGSYIPLKLDGIDGGLVAKPGERRPTIVYVHGRSANRLEMVPLADVLFKAGYNAVLWDGNSRQISYGPKEIDQISRIVSTIRNDPHVDADRIYVIGFSLGGAMAIGAAAVDTNRYIRGIVADSPYANLKDVASHYLRGFGKLPTPVVYPLRTVTLAAAGAIHGIEFDSRNPADWAERVTCPVLLIHGTSDRSVPANQSSLILERLRSPKELWLLNNIGHTKAFRSNPDEYVRRVHQFLSSKNLSARVTDRVAPLS